MSFLHRHKLLFGVIVTVSIIVYAAFNVWVYRSATNGKIHSPGALWQTVTKSGAGFPGVTGFNPATPSAPSTPTPRSTESGQYACSPEGTCNVYSHEMRRQYCTQTYIDSRCLDQCGDKEKQCKK